MPSIIYRRRNICNMRYTSGASLDLGNIEGCLLLDFSRFLACQRILLLDVLVCLHLLFVGDVMCVYVCVRVWLRY